MKLNRFLSRIFSGQNPFKALVTEVVTHPPAILKPKVHPAVAEARKILAGDYLEATPSPVLVARPLKAPVAAGAIEATSAGVAGAAAVVLVYIFDNFILSAPLPTEVYTAVLGLLTVVFTGVLKYARKADENAGRIEELDNENLKKDF